MGDGDDDALAETIDAMRKVELTHRRSLPNLQAMELAMLEWVDRVRPQAPAGPVSDIPPSEAEAVYDQQARKFVMAARLTATSLRKSRPGSLSPGWRPGSIASRTTVTSSPPATNPAATGAVARWPGTGSRRVRGHAGASMSKRQPTRGPHQPASDQPGQTAGFIHGRPLRLAVVSRGRFQPGASTFDAFAQLNMLSLTLL